MDIQSDEQINTRTDGHTVGWTHKHSERQSYIIVKFSIILTSYFISNYLASCQYGKGFLVLQLYGAKSGLETSEHLFMQHLRIFSSFETFPISFKCLQIVPFNEFKQSTSSSTVKFSSSIIRAERTELIRVNWFS